ncbi:hypothetical protein BDQ17DRAFT_381423 [Cyathus striatus]|nr:hypothetical protein BDQ17DRAFT_381423 [Cyathus striatus]
MTQNLDIKASIRTPDYNLRVYSTCAQCYIPADATVIHLRSKDNKEQESREGEERLSRTETRFVRMGAAKGRPDDMLEYGMRLCAGVRCILDEKAGLQLFLKVAEGSFPLEKRAVAYSLISHISKLRLGFNFADGGKALKENLFNAFFYANRSCELGLFSVSALFLLRFYDSTKLEREQLIPYQQFDALSQAYNQFRLQTGMQRLQARICTVCGNYPKQKSDLKRCGGGCPMAQQPLYCSRECQDWPRHKYWCKRTLNSPESERPSEAMTSG